MNNSSIGIEQIRRASMPIKRKYTLEKILGELRNEKIVPEDLEDVMYFFELAFECEFAEAYKYFNILDDNIRQFAWNHFLKLSSTATDTQPPLRTEAVLAIAK